LHPLDASFVLKYTFSIYIPSGFENDNDQIFLKQTMLVYTWTAPATVKACLKWSPIHMSLWRTLFLVQTSEWRLSRAVHFFQAKLHLFVPNADLHFVFQGIDLYNIQVPHMVCRSLLSISGHPSVHYSGLTLCLSNSTSYSRAYTCSRVMCPHTVCWFLLCIQDHISVHDSGITDSMSISTSYSIAYIFSLVGPPMGTSLSRSSSRFLNYFIYRHKRGVACRQGLVLVHFTTSRSRM
jgi:hypothetical protein